MNAELQRELNKRDVEIEALRKRIAKLEQEVSELQTALRVIQQADDKY